MLATLLELLTLFPIVDHTAITSATSIYENKTFHHGAQVTYDASFKTENYHFFLQPSWQHFHDNTYLGSVCVGFKPNKFEFFPGFDIAYDLSNFPGMLSQQASLGLSLVDEFMEVKIRHYMPWPKKILVGNCKVFLDRHTDFDFIAKIEPINVSMGFYDAPERLGVKMGLHGFFDNIEVSAHWRFDPVVDHTVQFHIGWKLPISKNKSFHHEPFFLYRKQPVMPLRLIQDNMTPLKSSEEADRKSTRLNSSHSDRSRMPSSA